MDVQVTFPVVQDAVNCPATSYKLAGETPAAVMRWNLLPANLMIPTSFQLAISLVRGKQLQQRSHKIGA
jgi:hypothetical protein